MKKIIFSIIVFVSFFSIYSNFYKENVYADEENIGNVTNDEEIAEQSVLRSSGIDYSTAIKNVENHLNTTYSNYTWSYRGNNSTKSVSNAIPINMQGTEFPESEVLEAVRNTGIPSSYGGCGPIAMMGILDYFSRYLGYTQIIEDPTK